jgi:adenine phosphoribosyltransferase
MMDLKTVIRDIPDFPKPGILFRDITPVLKDPAAFRAALDGMRDVLEPLEFDKIAAMESRGFLFAAPLAVELERGLVLLRKEGKLPGEVQSMSYYLEYGKATLEMHKDSCRPGDRVVVMDDLLATGGTALAAGRLIKKVGARVAAYVFFIELTGLHGRAPLIEAPVFSLVKYP